MKKIILSLCLLQITWCKVVDQTWWKYTTMYQVFLPSFKDGNGDGMGDLKGLISKLDHFSDMGIETIYITPHFKSPMVDSGYDIMDYTSVNPLMGTMEDFETLIREMNSRGLKLVIDLVINHSSDQHPWFIKSIKNEKPYADFYVWKDPKGYEINGDPIPPNNWLSVFDGSAWKWNDERKQFYLHQFSSGQPDFNLRNKFLKTEINKIFEFWMNKGVAGFRLDAVKHFLEDKQLRDEPLSSPDIKVPYKCHDLKHIYTNNIPDTYEYIYEIRRYFNRLSKKFTDFERVLIIEDYARGDVLLRYYGTEKRQIAHLPLNFFFVEALLQSENASFYHNSINNYLTSLPEWATPTWNIENHDKFRKGYLFGEDFEFLSVLLVMMLPGMTYLYYGQEIGLIGSKIRPNQAANFFIDDLTQTSRDYFRLPMHWDDSLNAGFSTNRDLYLPLSPNYWRINVKSQKETEHSYYHMFKKIVNLRKTDTLKYGDFESYIISTWVYAFSRTFKGQSYIVIFNFGSETEFIDLHNCIDDLPRFSIIEVASPNSGYKVGDKLPTMQEIPTILILRPLAALVLSTTHSSV
ncbi:maltase 1-like [Planococcus citri]|uniref:maltase 1-like n=1 Tax=Planococcus citri TaxID=170843 RepID=UPI0031F762C8